jgi:antitoxin component YwqK of YwqJK toxin-antitoxin module
MKILNFFLYFLITQIVKADYDTVFINQHLQTIEREKAEFKLIREKTNTNVAKSFCYSLNDKLLWKGELKGKNTMLRNGRFEYYTANNTIQFIAHYQNDKLLGEYQVFSEDGKYVKESRNYLSSLGDYTFHIFSKHGNFTSQTGAYNALGQKTGLWQNYFYNSVQVKNSSNYKEGRKDGESTEFYPNGNVKRREIYIYGKLSSKQMFDEQGNKVKYYPTFTYPSHKESLYKHLYRKTEFFKKISQTTAFEISFQVSKEGIVSDVNIDGIEDLAIRVEIENVLLKMTNWQPAYQENQAIDFIYRKSFKPLAFKE